MLNFDIGWQNICQPKSGNHPGRWLRPLSLFWVDQSSCQPDQKSLIVYYYTLLNHNFLCSPHMKVIIAEWKMIWMVCLYGVMVYGVYVDCFNHNNYKICEKPVEWLIYDFIFRHRPGKHLFTGYV